jgi:hypothetical protein
MRYRWKILTLLMLISILPIIGLRTFGIHNVHRLADALAAQLQESQLKDARSRVYQWMDGFLQTNEIKRQQVEMALAQQAMELRRSLGPENRAISLIRTPGGRPGGRGGEIRIRSFATINTENRANNRNYAVQRLGNVTGCRQGF